MNSHEAFCQNCQEKVSQNLSKTGSVYEALKDSDSNMKMTFSNVAISNDLCTKVRH